MFTLFGSKLAVTTHNPLTFMRFVATDEWSGTFYIMRAAPEPVDPSTSSQYPPLDNDGFPIDPVFGGRRYATYVVSWSCVPIDESEFVPVQRELSYTSFLPLVCTAVIYKVNDARHRPIRQLTFLAVPQFPYDKLSSYILIRFPNQYDRCEEWVFDGDGYTLYSIMNPQLEPARGNPRSFVFIDEVIEAASSVFADGSSLADMESVYPFNMGVAIPPSAFEHLEYSVGDHPDAYDRLIREVLINDYDYGDIFPGCDCTHFLWHGIDTGLGVDDGDDGSGDEPTVIPLTSSGYAIMVGYYNVGSPEPQFYNMPNTQAYWDLNKPVYSTQPHDMYPISVKSDGTQTPYMFPLMPVGDYPKPALIPGSSSWSIANSDGPYAGMGYGEALYTSGILSSLLMDPRSALQLVADMNNYGSTTLNNRISNESGEDWNAYRRYSTRTEVNNRYWYSGLFGGRAQFRFEFPNIVIQPEDTLGADVRSYVQKSGSNTTTTVPGMPYSGSTQTVAIQHWTGHYSGYSRISMSARMMVGMFDDQGNLVMSIPYDPDNPSPSPIPRAPEASSGYVSWFRIDASVSLIATLRFGMTSEYISQFNIDVNPGAGNTVTIDLPFDVDATVLKYEIYHDEPRNQPGSLWALFEDMYDRIIYDGTNLIIAHTTQPLQVSPSAGVYFSDIIVPFVNLEIPLPVEGGAHVAFSLSWSLTCEGEDDVPVDQYLGLERQVGPVVSTAQMQQAVNTVAAIKRPSRWERVQNPDGTTRWMKFNPD